MLKFYNNPMSNNARRVWIALLEKQIEFEPVDIKLDGDQFTPEFIEINPFHHVPVLIDDGFKVIESLAILDYLEAKYPTPALMPTDPQAIATVRMIQLVNVNELAPAIVTFMRHNLEIEVEAKQLEQAQQKLATVMKFYNEKLGDKNYFVEGQFTLADIVAGLSVYFLSKIGVSLADYPSVQNWQTALQQRESWQQVQPTPEQLEIFKAKVKAILSR
ncbi:glutathione S-transferase family protein [Moorena sp. SIO3H5]|uniref:glutathione S-transferase family protein n=1 Tax=Moorena sp. SIO3H5 TaxID=2607834 RepID=UPI0013B8F453|nr:glutathione S-transferase family protein [Moorena sp. SIO3H5]NEO73073.1 glutathione S-transferase family protein [Moorena sp. SIO3H5]